MQSKKIDSKIEDLNSILSKVVRKETVKEDLSFKRTRSNLLKLLNVMDKDGNVTGVVPEDKVVAKWIVTGEYDGKEFHPEYKGW